MDNRTDLDPMLIALTRPSLSLDDPDTHAFFATLANLARQQGQPGLAALILAHYRLLDAHDTLQHQAHEHDDTGEPDLLSQFGPAGRY